MVSKAQNQLTRKFDTPLDAQRRAAAHRATSALERALFAKAPEDASKPRVVLDALAETFIASGREQSGAGYSKQKKLSLMGAGLTIGVAAMLVGQAGAEGLARGLISTGLRPPRTNVLSDRLRGEYGARLREQLTATSAGGAAPAPAPVASLVQQNEYAGSAQPTPIADLDYAGTSVQPLEVQGCPGQYYQLNVQAGPQTILNLADTGSGFLIDSSVNCKGCKSPQSYDPSDTSFDTGEQQSIEYGTGGSGATATVYLDAVGLPPLAPQLEFPMLGITQQNNFFDEAQDCHNPMAGIPDPSSGIMGLGPAAGFFPSYSQTATYLPKVQAHQLCDHGGNWFMGGVHPNYLAGDPTFVPMNTSTWFSVGMSAVRVGGVDTGFTLTDNPRTLIDTGTEYFVLPLANYLPFVEVLAESGTELFGADFFYETLNCALVDKSISRDQVDAQLPQLDLDFDAGNGKVLTLNLNATRSYMSTYPGPNNGTYYCSDFAPDSFFGGSLPPIFGSPMMNGQVLIYDQRNPPQLGFAPQNYDMCPPPLNYAPNGGGGHKTPSWVVPTVAAAGAGFLATVAAAGAFACARARRRAASLPA